MEVLFKPEVYVAEVENNDNKDITDNFVQVVMSSLTGDVAELVCSVRGQPTPEVHWRKAGELDLALLAIADNVCW